MDYRIFGGCNPYETGEDGGYSRGGLSCPEKRPSGETGRFQPVTKIGQRIVLSKPMFECV
ncbi:hypothetical protein [Acetobacter sp. UBA5411]|uniref:hypothetical protein n=1 Tax=Acetobacter sp. UBA5411 TaxID=1945905 RepID=UPI0025C22DC9|nr:hypothetical protein [Acetobacter sp. UBA5411]